MKIQTGVIMISEIKGYLNRLKVTIDMMDLDEINAVINVIKLAYDNNKTIYIFGNGGSGSTASHIVCDINKGVSYGKTKRFKMICLNDNIATVLAYANDVSYDDIFIEQLKNYLLSGDVVIGISGSGNSMNVIKAIDYANENGGITIGFCGYDGGKLKNNAKYSIHAKIDDMQISEDIHLIMGHIIMRIFQDLDL